MKPLVKPGNPLRFFLFKKRVLVQLNWAKSFIWGSDKKLTDSITQRTLKLFTIELSTRYISDADYNLKCLSIHFLPIQVFIGFVCDIPTESDEPAKNSGF